MNTDIPLDQTVTPDGLSPLTGALMLSDLLIMSRPSTFGQNDPTGDYKVTLQQIHDWINGFINDHFKGLYASSGGLQAAVPSASDGDYAIVDSGDGQPTQYIWDSLSNEGDGGWVAGSSGGAGASTTDALPEGNTNLYFTVARAVNALNDYYLRYDMQQELNSTQMRNARRALGILGSTNMAPWDLTPQPVGQGLSSNYAIGRYVSTNVDIYNTITTGVGTAGDVYTQAHFLAPLFGSTPEWVCILPIDSAANNPTGYQFRAVIAKALTDLDDPGDGGLYIALCYDSDNPGLYLKTGIGGNSSTTMVDANYRPGTAIMLSINPTNFQLIINIGGSDIVTGTSVMTGDYYVFGVINIFSADANEHVLTMQMSTDPTNVHGRTVPGGAIPISTLQVVPPSDADKGVDYYVLQDGQYTNPYGDQQVFKLFACDVVRFANPNNIKYVIRNNNPTEQFVRPWPVAPTVDVVTPVIGVDDSSGVIVDAPGGVISSIALDITLPSVNYGPFSVLVGAVRTTMTLEALLSNNNGGVIGMQLLDPVSSSNVTVVAMVIAPKTVSAADIAAAMLTGYDIAPTITARALAYGVTTQFGLSGKIQNDDPRPNGGQFDYYQTNLTAPAVAQGVHSSLALCYDAGSLRIAEINVSQDSSAFDVMGGEQIGNNPAFPFADMAVFYAVLQGDTGGGFVELTIRPDMTYIMNGGTIVLSGTSYQTAGGTDNTWDALFPTGLHQIQSVSTTQVTFPPGTLVGDLLGATTSSGYQAAPYGININNGQKAVVENITPGSESFSILADGAQTQAALISMASNIAGLQTNFNELAAAVAANQLGSSEIIAYVIGYVFGSSLDLVGGSAFASLDDAYQYFITFPRYVKKRIVLDDRNEPSNTSIGIGANNVDYEFMENNIVISTYMAWDGAYSDVVKDTKLRLVCTSLHLDKFNGKLDVNPVGGTVMMTLGQSNITLPTDMPTTNNLVIGDNCTISTAVNGGSFTVPLNTSPNISIGDNCTVEISINYTNYTQAGGIATFIKGNNSSLALDGSMTGTSQTPASIVVITPRDSSPITWPTTSLEQYTEILYNAPATDPLFPGTTVIRTASDFGTTVDGIINIDPGTYVIAGDVSMYGHTLAPSGNISEENHLYRFIGLDGAALTGSSDLFVYPDQAHPCDLYIDGVNINNGGGNAFYYQGSFTIKNCKVGAVDMMRITPYPGYPSTLDMDNVELTGWQGAVLNTTMSLSFNNVRMNNIRGLVGGEVFCALDLAITTGATSIKNIDLTYTFNVCPGFVRLYGHDAWVTANQGVVDIITLESLNVKFVGEGNLTSPYTLVVNGDTNTPMDHTASPAIRTESSATYAVATGGTYLQNNGENVPAVVNVADTLDGNRFVSTNPQGLQYVGQVTKRFAVDFTLVLSCDTDTPSIEVELLKGDPSAPAITLTDTVALPVQSQPVTYRVRKIMSLLPWFDVLAFRTRNTTSANQFTVVSSTMEVTEL